MIQILALEMNQKLIIANVALASTFLLIVVLAFSGSIRFGNGLGDILYVGIAALAFLILLIFTLSFHLSRKASSADYTKLLLIFSTVLIYLIYRFTIGRGPEFSWNGQIFL